METSSAKAFRQIGQAKAGAIWNDWCDELFPPDGRYRTIEFEPAVRRAFPYLSDKTIKIHTQGLLQHFIETEGDLQRVKKGYYNFMR